MFAGMRVSEGLLTGWLDDGCAVVVPSGLAGLSSSTTANPPSLLPAAASKKITEPALLRTPA